MSGEDPDNSPGRDEPPGQDPEDSPGRNDPPGLEPGGPPGRGPPDSPGQGRGPPDFDVVRYGKRAVERTLRDKQNVHAVAVGKKAVDGRKTDELSIVVHVVEKVPEDELEESDRVPRRIKIAGRGAVKTDVKESAIPTMDSTTRYPPRRSAHRPLVGGTQIMREGGSSYGTMGGLVETAAGELREITNRHVVSETDAGPTYGDNVVQPDGTDGVVAHVEEWSSLDSQSMNTSDSALLSLASGIEAANHVLTAGTMGPPTTVSIGDTCIHSGVRTYGVAAEVSELDYTGLVQSSSGNTYEYTGIIEFDPSMADGGDSGAFWGVYDDATGQFHPVGLHFAGGRLAIPWSALEDTHGELTPPSAAAVADYVPTITSNRTGIIPYELETGSRAVLKCITAAYGDPASPTGETVQLFDGPIVDGEPTGTVIGEHQLETAWGVVEEIEFRGLIEKLGVGTHTVTLSRVYGADREYTITIGEPTEHRFYGTVTNTAGEIIADASVDTYSS